MRCWAARSAPVAMGGDDDDDGGDDIEGDVVVCGNVAGPGAWAPRAVKNGIVVTVGERG